MADKKELSQQELEKVNGGAPYSGSRPPVASDFYHQVNDVVTYCMWETNATIFYTFRVTALGAVFTGAKGPTVWYTLLYKFETIDRALSSHDGWYDFDLLGPTLVVKKVSGEGITIVDQI